MTTPLLSVHDVHKRIGDGARAVDVLRGVNFEAGQGEALAIVGPSGSGKSTLLHLVGALDRPSSGVIAFDGRRPYEEPEPELARFRNRTIGFVFQDAHLLPQFTVLENVLVPTLAFRDGAEDAEPRARKLLADVGLSQRLTHRPAELSGGERQRVAVARALIQAPRLVLCDEPTGSLDQANAAAVTTLLFDLHRASGAILLCVTHSAELASRFPRVLELVDGVSRERG